MKRTSLRMRQRSAVHLNTHILFSSMMQLSKKERQGERHASFEHFKFVSQYLLHNCTFMKNTSWEVIYLDVSLLSTHFMEHFLHDRAQKRMAIKGFLVLELITGGELFDFIVEQHTLSEKVASSFIQQILGVLDYCHKRGRVHFYSLAISIKEIPRNIL